MNSELIIGERPFQGGLILDLEGDLTKQAENELLKDLGGDRGLTDGQALALNLTRVAYMNSSGLALLIRLAQACLQAGVVLFAYGVSAHYQKMFRLIGLTELIVIDPDEYAFKLRFQ